MNESQSRGEGWVGLSLSIPAIISMLLVLAVVGIYLAAGEALVDALSLILQVGGISLVASIAFLCLIGVLYAGWLAYQRGRAAQEARWAAAAQRRLLEAQALREERDAQVLVVTAKAGEQILIRDTGHGQWRQAHLDMRLYANGAATDPSPLEIAVWREFNRPASVQPVPALPIGQPSFELPTLVRWSEVVPGQRGDLNNLILGLRLNEQGQLAPLTISLYELFHTIAAASSGWGKSAFLSAILAQLATCPDPVELVLIDQQLHGLAAFKECDRLRYPILQQPGEILGALHEVYAEAIQYRADLLRRYDADNLAEYNQKAEYFLPPVIVAVDEASALLADRDIGQVLKRQAWELRKFGVYQMLALTSAKGTVIDTDHRQQFSSKVQLHANDKSQARLLLDAVEALDFPPGRAVVDVPGLSPAVVQTPFIPKRELRSLLKPAGQSPAPPAMEPELIKPTDKQQVALNLWDSGERSASAIAFQVYNDAGGRQIELVNKTLRKFGRI